MSGNLKKTHPFAIAETITEMSQHTTAYIYIQI